MYSCRSEQWHLCIGRKKTIECNIKINISTAKRNACLEQTAVIIYLLITKFMVLLLVVRSFSNTSHMIPTRYCQLFHCPTRCIWFRVRRLSSRLRPETMQLITQYFRLLDKYSQSSTQSTTEHRTATKNCAVMTYTRCTTSHNQQRTYT